jgi:hypothetical protein
VRLQTQNAPAPQGPQTLVAQHIQFIIDDVEFVVKQKRKTVGAEVWEEHLRIRWSTARNIGFATDRYDPIVALYILDRCR